MLWGRRRFFLKNIQNHNRINIKRKRKRIAQHNKSLCPRSGLGLSCLLTNKLEHTLNGLKAIMGFNLFTRATSDFLMALFRLFKIC